MRAWRCAIPLAFLWAATLVAAEGRADEKRVELLSLVRSDAAACLDARDLKSLAGHVRQSDWFGQVRETRLFQDWKASGDFQKFDASLRQIEAAVEEKPETFLGGLLGERVVVALYATANDTPDGLLLLEAESSERLSRTLSFWNRLETATLSEHPHAGAIYVRRSRGAGDKPAEVVFYLQRGRLLAISESEAIVRDVAESLNGSAEDRLSDAEEFRAAQQLLPVGGPIRLFLQPQRFRKGASELAKELRDVPELLRSWASCTSISLRVAFDEGWTVDVAGRFPETSASDRWKQFVERSRRGPRDAVRPPVKALAAWSSGMDLSELSSLIPAWIPAPQKKDAMKARQVARGLLLGFDPLDDLLPRLGPQVGGWIAERREGGGALPWTATLHWGIQDVEAGRSERRPGSGPLDEGTKVSRGSGGQRGDFTAALDNAIGTGLNLAAAGINSRNEERAVVARSETAGDARLRWLEGLGFGQPAVAVTSARLWFSSDRSALQREMNAPASEGMDLEAALVGCVESPDHWWVVDVAGIRNSLATHREVLAKKISREKPAESLRRMDGAIDLLQIVDHLALAARIDERTVRATLSARHRKRSP